MNPFEDYTNNTNTDATEKPIYIWVENNGRKHNTYVTGWDVDDSTIKSHLKTIKTKTGCNGSVKISEVNGNSIERVLQLQGDKADYVKDFIVKTGVDAARIYIKG